MGNPYDALAAGIQPPNEPTTGNPYDSLVADIQVQQPQRARTVFEKSLAVNPDQAAESQRLAKQTGLALDVVERNLEEVRRKEQARMLDIARMAQDSPILARQLDDPTFTKQAHDDVSTLGQIEQFLRDTAGSAKAGLFNASKGSAGVFRAGFEFAAPALDVLEPVTAIGGNPLRRLAEGFAMQAEAAGSTAKAAAPKTEGVVSGGFQSGVQSLTQNLLALPFAFVPGGQGVALGSMTAFTGGQSYQDARQQGVSMSQALPFAASQAAIEYATEKLPLGQLIGDVKAGTSLLKTVAKQMALEVPGEQIATVLQDMNEWAVLPENKDKPFRDYLAERPNAAAQTFIATLVGTGGNVAVAKGIETATRKLMGDAYDAGLADQSAQQLQAQLAAAMQSKLRERNPEAFRDLVQQMAENTEGAPQEIYVDAEVLNQLPQEVLQALPENVLSQMAEALAANDVVSIPLADVLTVAPGTVLEQTLVQNARIGDPRAMSQVEAQQAGEQAQQYLAQEAERVIAEATDQQAMQASADRVKQSVLDQLNTAARFSPDVNEAYATWTTAFYTTMAGRLGTTPEEMAARYPLRIGAQGAASGQQLEQGAPEYQIDHKPMTVEGGASTLDDLTGAFGEDIYGKDALQFFGSGDVREKQVVRIMKSLRGKPDAMVTIYRGVPAEAAGINPGDWVTLSKETAQDYADQHEGGKIVSLQVPASHVTSWSDSLLEFGYYPPQQTLAQSATTYTADTINVDGVERPTTNSNGKPIAQTEEGLRNFWRWFGDSKVVDASGKPLVVYHGSPKAGFDEFDVSNVGAFFSSRYDIAASYAGAYDDVDLVDPSDPEYENGYDESKGVYSAYLKIENPKTADWGGEDWGRGPDGLKTDEFSNRAKREGNDGVIMENVVDTGWLAPGLVDDKGDGVIYAVFSPTQIKSAIGNNGQFDPTNPNILRQQTRGTFNPSTLELVLTENADLSTFLHESGHFFLEVMADLASQPDAPADIQSDMSALLKWFGIKGDETVGGPDAGGTLAQMPAPEGFKTKVVGKDGRPLVVYHGTTADIAKFDPAKSGSKSKTGAPEGTFFFTDKADVASSYTVAWQGDFGSTLHDGANVMPVYLEINKPLKVNARGENWRDIEYKGQFYDINELATIAKESGKYDGVIVTNVRDKGVGSVTSKTAATYIAFKPEQIVSASTGGILAQDGNLPTDDTQPVRRTPLETWRAMTLDQKRKYHERFAESMEQYLMEGKAPSVELAPLFRKFRRWMEKVYTDLKSFLRAHPDSSIVLNDEIRRVFDRMIASREQIAQAEEIAGLVPNEEATAAAVEALTARSLRDMKWLSNAKAKAIKALQKQAASLRKEVEAEVRAEVEAMPEVKAKRAMDKLAITPEHQGLLDAHKAERAKAQEAFRAEITQQMVSEHEVATGEVLKGIKKGQFLAKSKREVNNLIDARMIEWDRANPRPQRPVNYDDMDLAIVADSFGFDSIESMVQAIADFGDVNEVVEGMTDQRMLERHGDLTDDRAIEDAANEAIHNDVRARVLATELKAQADALGARRDTGQTNAAGGKVTVNVLVEAAKQFAANVIARTPIRDLKARARQHMAAERRAAKRWREATAAGKTEEAIKAKQDQMLNHAAAKAAMDAQTELQKFNDFFRRVVKDGNEKTVEKGRDPDVVNAARAVLGAYGISPRMAKSAIEYLKSLRENDPVMFASVEPVLQAAADNAQPFDALTMDEARNLYDEVQNLWHIAKRSRQMEVDGNLMDIEDAESELQDRLQEIGVPDEVPGEKGAITKAEAAGRMLQHVGAMLTRAEQWAERMDGKFGGAFMRLVFQPIKTAADKYRTARVEYRRAYQALVDEVAPHLKKGLIEAPELGYTFGQGHNGIGHAELLHAILHTGNDSNKRKLLLGRGWATENPDGTLDTSKWDAFIARMISDGTLTKAHYDFAQGVWDLLEKTKPLAQKAHRDVFGRYFDEVSANAFDTPFGQYRGGYVPAQADPRIANDADTRKLYEAENENMAFSFPTTNNGFTKSRTEYNRPLILDLRTIGQHIDKVLLFSHMEPAVRDVNRLLTRKGIAYSLGRIDPTIYAGLLKPWLKRSATQVVETPAVGDGGVSRVAATMRNRAGMALMFANVSNALQQVTGFSLAAVKVKPAHIMRATAQFIAHPKQTAQAVADASAFMRNRMENEIAAINNAMDDILLDPSLFAKAQQWTRKHAYFMQIAVANTMEPIIWTAAYNESLTGGLSEQDAVRFADNVIRTTQGSTLPEDVSRAETGNAYMRLFNQFIGYFNMMANTNATALKNIAAEMGVRKGAGKMLYVVAAGLLVPMWVAEAIAVAMRGGPDDKDKDGYLDDWIAAVIGMGTIKGSLAMVPYVGQLANAAINRFNDNPADDKTSLSPAVSLLEAAVGVPADVYKAIADPDKLNKRNAVRDAASAISIATGLPAYAVARPLGYMAGVEDRRIHPTGPGDMARGLVTGSASPESK